jgi:hypothetical protein
MADTRTPLPTDHFSLTLREKRDNPGAISATSTIETQDFYGNAETWVVTTFRTDAGDETIFLQRSAHDGGMRHVLPPVVAAAIARQRDQLTSRNRRRGARKAVETKRAAGTPVGNPDALRNARRARAKRSR